MDFTCAATGRSCSRAGAAVADFAEHRPRPHLAPREKEVLIAWLEHGTKASAARSMFLTPSTVKTHIERVRDKYAAIGRPAPTMGALLVRLVQDGLLDIGDLNID